MSDRGSGSVLIIAVIGAVVALTLVGIPLYLGLATRQALIGAADAAALAGADAASGATAGVPCDRAAQLASANGARLDACQVDGYVVTVVVSRVIVGFRTTATATAGPPGAEP